MWVVCVFCCSRVVQLRCRVADCNQNVSEAMTIRGLTAHV